MSLHDSSRRSFLKLGLLASGGIVRADLTNLSCREAMGSLSKGTRYEELLAESPVLDRLGLPRSWWHVAHHLHPFSPQRVVILERMQTPNCLHELRTKILADESCCVLAPGQVDIILLVAHSMAVYYGKPNLTEPWATSLAWRVAFAGWADEHFALLHQFQFDGGPIETDNRIVDWWLFLTPSGVDFRATDNERVHAFVAHIFTSSFRDGDRIRQINAWAAAERLWRRVDWPTISAMDRRRASVTLNHELAECLATLDLGYG